MELKNLVAVWKKKKSNNQKDHTLTQHVIVDKNLSVSEFFFSNWHIKGWESNLSCLFNVHILVPC